jgi:phenylalanyl-tRNA synthetase beta chain
LPVTTLVLERLKHLVGNNVSTLDLVNRLPYIGLDIESVSDSEVKVEYSPNRPDFSTDIGIARALKGLLGVETGCPTYGVEKSSVLIKVDSSVKEVRPFILGCIISEIKLDDETIRQVIAMQEDLHNGIGRRRERVAIGFHNFQKIKPPITYRTSDGTRSFIPLGENRKITAKEILEQTEQGRIYGKTLATLGKFPLLVDSNDEVLSMPPVINSELTRVDESVKEIFVDITGTEQRLTIMALNIISTTLSDLGGKILSVKIKDGKKSTQTPNLKPDKERVDTKLASQLLGIDLNRKQIIQCLRRARLGSRVDRGKLFAVVPPYRFDIIHPVDLVEEIAIGYGVDNFSPTLPASKSTGQFSSKQIFLDCVRETCIGLGLEEVTGYSLIPARLARSFCESEDDVLMVEETKSAEHEMLKTTLVTDLMSILAMNIHNQYPQKIFEIGTVFSLDPKRGGVVEKTTLGVAIAYPDANFTEMKSHLESILTQIGKANSVKALPFTFPGFVPGRSAALLMENVKIGKIGEISPDTLRSMSIKMPTTAFEAELEPLFGMKGKHQD